MSETPVDSSKRTWIITSACAGAVGGVAAAVPFVSTFQPSEKAKAAGAAVEVDISALQPGEMKTVEWRGKPVWVLRRTKQQLEELSTLNSELADPNSERVGFPYPRVRQERMALDQARIFGAGWHLHPLGLLAHQ